MKIVIVEDDKTIRDNLHEILEAYGYEVSSYEDGLQGLGGIKQIIPDLVVCDIMLPLMDGYQVLKQLKSEELTRNIPFIFLTARSERADQRKGMELGADDFIVKPFTTQELINAINTRLQKEKNTENKIQDALYLKLHDFTKINSHEYNTPLNGILGLSSTLIDSIDQLSKDEIVEVAKAIRTSSKRLFRTFKNFLLYIQIQRAELKSHKTLTDASWILAHAENLLNQKAMKFNRLEDAVFEKSVNGNFELQLPTEDLSYLLEELVWNAFKFSKRGEKVSLLVETDQKGFSVHVRNPSKERFLFEDIEAFKQFDRAAQEQQGSGLGLYLCKKISEIYAWKLSAVQKADILTMSLQVTS